MAREGLNPADPGVRLLARAVADVPAGELLLVCSGALPGARPGATRLITDARERAEAGERCAPLDLAGAAELAARPERYAAAAVWPRAHLGKDFSLLCLARGALSLRPGGDLLCAARKDKGGASLAAAMEELLGAVEIEGRDRGYTLYRARRRGDVDAAAAARMLEARYTITDPLLGPTALRSAPGVFCRRHLDDGTRALLERLAVAELAPPRRVVDLGAGIGPITIWAARRWPAAEVLAVECNLLAAALIAENAALAGVGARVRVAAGDGLPATPTPTDLLLSNPPTHAGEEELTALVAPLPRWLAPGEAWFVVNRPGRIVGLCRDLGAAVTAEAAGGFHVVRARFG